MTLCQRQEDINHKTHSSCLAAKNVCGGGGHCILESMKCVNIPLSLHVEQTKLTKMVASSKPRPSWNCKELLTSVRTAISWANGSLGRIQFVFPQGHDVQLGCLI